VRVHRFLQEIIPPFISRIYFKYRNRNANPPIDIASLNSLREFLPTELFTQVEAFLSSDDFLKTSKYWRHLILRHLQSVSNQGIENWGTSVARNYFTWTQLEDIKLEKLSSHYQEDLNYLKVHNGLTPAESYSYNVICNLLWVYLKNLSNFPLSLVASSSAGYEDGNSPKVEIDGVVVTQDLLNSAIEYESFRKVLRSEGGKILEIGAGSGRNADFMLSTGFVEKYVIVDIPPASFISQERISRSHPNLRVISCTKKNDLVELLHSEDWDILFILPSLAGVLPDKFFDITLAIDCLHEMTKETRLFYSELAAAKSENFYVKIWNKAYIPVDKEFLDAFSFDQYGFDEKWTILESAQCVYPADFHEYLFKINGL
jgi:putative sugar O-methyltransferase